MRCCVRARSRARTIRSRWRARSARRSRPVASRAAQDGSRGGSTPTPRRRTPACRTSVCRRRLPPIPPMAEPDLLPASPDRLLDRWEAAWSGRDADAFAPLCDGAVQYEDPLTRLPLVGVDELVAHAELLWRGFPDVRVERAGERLSDGRFVAAPCKLAGTHRGALEGLPASDRFLI